MISDLKNLNEHLSWPVPDNFQIFKDFYESLKCSISKTFSVDDKEFSISEMRDIILEIEDNFEVINELENENEVNVDQVFELKHQIKVLEDDLKILTNENTGLKEKLKKYEN